MPVFGTGPKRPDGRSNFLINNTPYTNLPSNYPKFRTGPPLMGYKLLPYSTIISNAFVWYDVMDTTTLASSGVPPPNNTYISFLKDKSGNAYNLSGTAYFNLMNYNYNIYPTLSVWGFQPTPATKFSYSFIPPANVYTGCNISAFFVLAQSNMASGAAAFALMSSFNTYVSPSTTEFNFGFSNNQVGFSRFRADDIITNSVIRGPYTSNTLGLFSCLINGGNTTIGNVLPSTNLLSINGNFVSSSTQYAGCNFYFDAIRVFGNNFNPASQFNTFAEIAVFNRVLTTQERTTIESQLINKWKLPSNAPVSYLNAGPNISTPYLWVDAYSSSNVSTTVTSDGLTRVDTVFDRSGNGRNFNVISGNSNVFYNRVSTMNQFNSLYFSTGSYAGIISNTVPINSFSTNSYSFFMVYNQLSTNSLTRLFAANNQAGSDNGTIGGFSYQILNQTPYFTPYNYQNAGANINNGTNYLTSVIVNDGPTFDIYQTSTFNIYTNSGSGPALTSNINSASTNLLNISKFNIGGNTYGNTFCFNGLISEVILYNRALSNAERQTIESYLINKWGISTIQSNVPVKSGLNLWLDAYDPSCVITDSNSNVLLWRDKSIYNYNFSNYTSNYPVYKNNPQNGLPSISITSNATTQALVNSNFNISSISSFSVLGVVNLSNTTINGRIFSILSTSQQLDYQIDNGFVIYNNFGTGVGYSRSSFQITGTATSNTNNLFSLIVNNISTQNDVVVSTTALGINGVMKQFLAPTTNSTINVNLGYIGTSKNNDNTMKYSGLISELLFYNRTLSFVERQQVESYLMSKWKIWYWFKF